MPALCLSFLYIYGALLVLYIDKAEVSSSAVTPSLWDVTVASSSVFL